MKTNYRLILKALIILSIDEISLEGAVTKASRETNLSLDDDIKIIRDFLCKEGLLKHNPRLTYPNHKEYQPGTNIAIVYDKIDDAFINDHLTEKCTDLINIDLLHDHLFKSMIKG